MAYQPISQPKKSGGYVPIGQTNAKPEIKSFFPAKQQVFNATARQNQAPTTQEKLVADKSRGVSISQGQPEKVNPILRAIRALPGESRFEKTLERDVYNPIAKVGSFLAPSPSDMMRQIVDENPKVTADELQKELQKRVSQNGVALTGPDGVITPETKVISPEIVGMIKKIPGKIAQRFIGAKSVDEATALAREIGIRNPGKSIIDDILRVSDEKSAQDFIDGLKAKNIVPTSEMPSLPKLSPSKSMDVIPATKQSPTVTPKAVSKAVSKEAVQNNIPITVAKIAKSSNPEVIKRTIIDNIPVLKNSDELTPLVNVLRAKTKVKEIAGILEPAILRAEEKLPKKFTATKLPVANPGEKIVYFAKTGGDEQFVTTNLDELTNQVGDISNIEIGVVKNADLKMSPFPEKAAVGIGTIPRQVADQVVSANRVTDMPTLPKLSPEIKKILRQRSSDATVNEAVLNRYRAAARKPVKEDTKLAKAAKQVSNKEGIKKLTGELLTPISSRLERINPELKTVLRKFEFSVASKTTEDASEILPLLQSSKKMSAADQSLFDLARKNGDTEVIEALAARYGIEDELNRTRDVLDGIYQRAKEVGMDVQYRKDYFPRMITNPEKFMAYLRGSEDWGTIQKLIEEAAKKKGIRYTDLTDEEKAGIVNNFIRGYGDKVTLSKPGFTKSRTLEVLDDNLNEFYESTDSAISTYVIRMNDEIEGRRFFGKELKTDVGDADMSDSIGTYVLDLVANKKIKPDQEKEVSDILKARFHRGKMNGALDVYRNLEYVSTMGSPISAITQIGDLAFSVYDSGFYHSTKGLGKSLFSKNKLSKEDLGIENITQEFTKNTMSGKTLDTIFQLTGLSKMDRLGKETLVNGYLSKAQSLARKSDDTLKRDLDLIFDPEEAAQAMEELAKGQITERTKLLAFNKLLDFQPVAKSEMPQKYLEMPNGRIFYMLKSFTLKQFDIFRRESIDHIVSGDKKRMAKGMKNLMLLSGAFFTANAAADEVKDLVLGRETPPSDRVVDNLWRLVGASKYDVYKARQDGVGQTVTKKILFPTSVWDRLSKDVAAVAEDKRYEKGPLKGDRFGFESTQTIPVGGKLYYWWFGRGAQKEENKDSTATSTEGVPSLPELPTLPKLPKI